MKGITMFGLERSLEFTYPDGKKVIEKGYIVRLRKDSNEVLIHITKTGEVEYFRNYLKSIKFR